MKVGRNGGRREVPTAAQEDSDGTPDKQSHNHYSCDLHNAESLPARFLNTFYIRPPEVERDNYGKERSKRVRVEANCLVGNHHQLVK
jgi:hypothetical protein